MHDLRELIRVAFDAARLQRKPTWHRMSAEVLKNRMIQASGRAFRESDYGASGFIELLRGLPDLVRIDDATRPPTVELLGAEPESEVVPPVAQGRVRPDLWAATIDYRSGTRYVWDTASGQARPATPEDVGPYTPTITSDTARAWRSDFFAENRPLFAPGDLANAEEWVQQGLGGFCRFASSIAGSPGSRRTSWIA